MLPTFLENLNVGSIHVYSPRPTIFVCGGKTAQSAAMPPESIRDALLRANVMGAITKANLFIVERITESFLRERVYDDFYEFENDMAQICDLVFLISESPGSFTELGSFVRDTEVANKLFTVIRSTHFWDGSYIDVGPIKYLENNQNGSVFVISDQDYRVDEADYSKLDTQLLARRLEEPVRHRLKAAREHKQFAKGRNGHLCKFVVGLVQDFGALEIAEIQNALDHLRIGKDQTTAERLVFCAKTIDWVRADRRGLRTFILPNTNKRAAKFVFNAGPIPTSTERRRLAIRDHWQATDEERVTAILANSERLAQDAENE
jgi:hypothetical protein